MEGLQWHDLIVAVASGLLGICGAVLTFKVKQGKFEEQIIALKENIRDKHEEVEKDFFTTNNKVNGLCRLIDTLRKEKASEGYANDLKERIMKLDDEKVEKDTCEKCQAMNNAGHDAIIEGQKNAIKKMDFGFTEVKELIKNGR